MFNPNFSTASTDYMTFLDGGSRVPYHQDNVKYYPMPYNKIEELEFENKIYIHAHSGYYVSIVTSQWVRKITSQDYKYVKAQIDELSKDKKLINKSQLTMDFS